MKGGLVGGEGVFIGSGGEGWCSDVCCLEGESIDSRTLEVLKGLEKLNVCLAARGAPTDNSEPIDGDLGKGGTKGDKGECGIETPLLDDSFLGCENIDPALELV